MKFFLLDCLHQVIWNFNNDHMHEEDLVWLGFFVYWTKGTWDETFEDK